ncbi:MAG: hypothetical protein ACKVT0_19290 [Planctomycetaceae bacterium]
MEMFDWELWQKTQWSWGLLILIITAGAAAIFKIRSRMRESDDPAASARQMLLQMKELNQEGVLSEAEYRKINSRLSVRTDDAPIANTHSVKPHPVRNREEPSSP